MPKEKEVRKETDFWGNEREFIYENDRKVGEIKTEERGGVFGMFGGEPVKVECDNTGKEISYTKQEERGGFLGIGAEPTEVRYDSSDKEIGHSRVEERGGLLGIGGHHVRVEYDENGNEVSQTNTERRGGFLGIGSSRVRVTRYSTTKTNAAPGEASTAPLTAGSSPVYGDGASIGSPQIRKASSFGALGLLGWSILLIIILTSVILLVLPRGSSESSKALQALFDYHGIAIGPDGREALARYIAEGPDVNTTVGGHTLLEFAVYNEFLDIAEELIRRGATVNESGAGDYPLYTACTQGNYKMAKILIENGANVNFGRQVGRDQVGWTPLLAAIGTDDRLVELLLSRGARVDAVTPEGLSPLDLALASNATSQVRLLKEAGARRNRP